jgi:hypothetical protein
MDAWLQTQDDSLRLYECLGLEVEKQVLHEVCIYMVKKYMSGIYTDTKSIL